MNPQLTAIQNKIYEIRGQRVMLDFDSQHFIKSKPAHSSKRYGATSNIFLKISCSD